MLKLIFKWSPFLIDGIMTVFSARGMTDEINEMRKIKDGRADTRADKQSVLLTL
jgi:hypothetical protein